MYAIVDVETTGGKYNEEGITEIAIYKFDGTKTVDQFITLVNPEQPIQPFVVNLTGISDKMVKNAPKFHEIAKRIIEIMDGCVLVAHNANFDYRIIKTEFKRLGYDFIKDTLCTVELSRKLLPNLPSYSLGKLCKSIGIPTSNRHRANGDTIATLQLLKLLLAKDVDKKIIKANIKSEGKEKSRLNVHLQKLLDQAPRKTGVYYLHNEEGDVLYIGKHKNMRSGLNQLFLRTSKNAKTLQKRVHSISFEETGSLIIASIKINEELSMVKPKFNFKSKKTIPTTVFNIENAVLMDSGRTTSEKSVFLIEDSEVKGYAYVDFSHQIDRLDILKNIITPIKDNLYNRDQIKKSINSGKFHKIIRF